MVLQCVGRPHSTPRRTMTWAEYPPVYGERGLRGREVRDIHARTTRRRSPCGILKSIESRQIARQAAENYKRFPELACTHVPSRGKNQERHMDGRSTGVALLGQSARAHVAVHTEIRTQWSGHGKGINTANFRLCSRIGWQHNSCTPTGSGCSYIVPGAVLHQNHDDNSVVGYWPRWVHIRARVPAPSCTRTSLLEQPSCRHTAADELYWRSEHARASGRNSITRAQHESRETEKPQKKKSGTVVRVVAVAALWLWPRSPPQTLLAHGQR